MVNVVVATRATWYWLLRVIITAWASDVARTKAAEHKQENHFLRRALGKRADSIWLANQDDLVRMAVLNPRLGLDEATARSMRVGELRYIMKKDKQQNAIPNPLPVGLAKMKKETLQQLCIERGISILEDDTPTGNGKWKVREQMISDLKQQAEKMMKDLQYPDGDVMDLETAWEEADALSDEVFTLQPPGTCEQYSLPQQDPLSSRSVLVETGITIEEAIGRMMQHQHLPIVRAALEQIATQQ